MNQQVSRVLLSECSEGSVWLGHKTAGIWIAEAESRWAGSLTPHCVAAADDLGSEVEDNEFGQGEEEDGGSDYEEKKGKKVKKAKVEKPAKRGPKRKRPAGNISTYQSDLFLTVKYTVLSFVVLNIWNNECCSFCQLMHSIKDGVLSYGQSDVSRNQSSPKHD